MSPESYPEGEIEEWQWEAHYLDGSILYQSGHKFKDIEQDKLHSFYMVHKERAPLILMWDPSYKLIHFYRVVIAHGSGGEQRLRLYCFGYQTKDLKNIFVIMPDGGLVITDDINKVRVYI